MKANELMVGDWVRFKSDSEVTKVDAYGLCNWVLSNIEPIPLTAEILKKNEWIYDESELSWYHKNVLFDVELVANSIFLFEYRLCRAIYVHELQHALRLCGQDDLADNFKV